MKSTENYTAKARKEKVTTKPFPLTIVKGKSMDEKNFHAKAISASIKHFKEKK